MRRAAQLAAAGRLPLASSSRATASCQQLFLQQLHSSSTTSASAAEPAFAADAQEGAYTASNLDFFKNRLHINEWGAVSSIPDNDPTSHLRVNPEVAQLLAVALTAVQLWCVELE
jgi:hypothetical protein